MTAWRTPVTLTGRHVTLRPLAAEDKPALVAAARDAEVDTLFFMNAGGLLADPDAYVQGQFVEQSAGRGLPFVVEAPGRGVVGMTRFLRMNEAHRRVELGGTFYAKSVQRTGVNTEAKLLLLSHAFDVLGCQVVQIRTDWFNKRSQAAIERLGARRDGVLRNHQLLHGRVRDIVVYSIIAGEWPGVRTNLGFLLERAR